MQVSRASLEALEFDSLRRVSAEFAATDLGAARLLTTQPFDSLEDLRRSLAATREVGELLEDGSLVRGFEEELSTIVESVVDERAEIRGQDLLLVAAVLTASQTALERIRAAKAVAPALQEAVESTPDLGDLIGEIGRVVDERGRVRDDASSKLKRLAEKGRRTRRGLYSSLGEFVSGHRDNLAEETVSVHDGRLVLLLRSGSKGKLAGIVQGRSATGKSFYFEPLDFVEANNDLQESQREEEAERLRILGELVARVRGHAADIEEHWRLLSDLDARQALCRLRQRMDGHFIEPAEGPLELREARHPLLDPALADHRERALGQAGHREAVVPLHLSLDESLKLLVVTGPNAGGKTVALKTVGLLTLASHCGFPLPADLHSRVPFIRSLVAVVGDDQDLLAERSTFSGRLLRLSEVWESAEADSLLLIDELGSGTDPTEGAALGISLVESLASRRSWTVITTHLSAIAASALELVSAGCAAMEFDARNGQPTYKLVPGTPGGSEALALARRLSLPGEWISRAEELLGPEERRLRRLLQEVEEAKRSLTERLEELSRLEADAERDREEAALLMERAATEKKEVSKRLERQLRDFRVSVQRKLSDETDRIRKALETGSKKSAAARVAAELFEDAPEFEAPEGAERPLEIGVIVEHRTLGWQGRLEKLAGDKASVGVRGKRVACRAGDLVVVENGTPAVGLQETARPKPASSATVSAAVTELMLIGQRVEPALEELERFLDRALLEERDSVRIVHGHGSGRLRAAVRERLRGHAAVASWRPGGDSEGGDGATVATLA